MSRKGTTRRRCGTCGRTVKDYQCSAGHRAPRTGGWEFSVDVGPPGGPRKRITKGGFDTQKEALAAMDEVKRQASEGRLVERVNLTLGEYLRSWLAGVAVRPNTRHFYEIQLRKHVLPKLGDTRLQALTREQIRRLYAELATEAQLAPSSIQRVHAALHKALADAVEDNLIARNPAVGAFSRPKAADREEMRIWTAGQVKDFLASVESDRLAGLWRLLLFAGLRRGEALALRWDDFDPFAATLRVQRQLTRFGVTPPKSARSRRVIDLDPGTVDAMNRHRIDQEAEREAWGRAYKDSGLMFCREDGQALDPDSVSHRWNTLVKNSGLPRIRLHDARHTHASLLLLSGVPAHVVSMRLGHSNVAFTLSQYSHVLPTQQAEAAARFAALVDGDLRGEDAAVASDGRQAASAPYEAEPRTVL